MLKWAIPVVAVAWCAPACATTLQQLNLDNIIQKSTAIVRGSAQQTYAELRGSVIYTHYRIQVSDQWKGASAAKVDVAVPGGWLNGKRQTYAGAPVFSDGQDYLFFLWTSRTGLTQVIGLSQGLFSLSADMAGNAMVTRTASPDQMLDAGGHPVSDTSFSMRLCDLKTRVSAVLGKAAQ